MTQRTFIETPLLRSRPDPLWISFGESVASVFEGLFGAPRGELRDVPRQVLRDHDPGLHDALQRADQSRAALDGYRRNLLY